MKRETPNQAQLSSAIAEFKGAEPSGAALCRYLADSNAELVGAFRGDQRRWSLWVRPPEQMRSMFGLSLDLVLLVAPYTKVEPRVLSQLAKARQDERFDPDVALLATKDSNIDELLQKRNGGTAIVHISLERVHEGLVPPLGAILQQQLVAVDHFRVSRSLKSDDEFFGRTSDIEQIAATIQHSRQHVGLFGLRKVGKTSLMNRVAQVLEQKGWKTGHVDINDVQTGSPSGQSLEVRLARALSPGGRGDLDATLDELDDVPGVLLVVDELDEVLPSRMGGERSREFLDALARLRAVTQRRAANDQVSPVVLAAGVDTAVFESSVFAGRTNPLYGFPQLHFLRPMSYQEAVTMVRALGKRMAMRFGDSTLQALWEEYGGMPFLMRLACSQMHKERPKGRIPYEVTFDAALKVFKSSSIGSAYRHAREIPTQFADWFPDEAEVVTRALLGKPVSINDAPHAHEYGLLDADGNVAVRALVRH
jgi:hypothetical protein